MTGAVTRVWILTVVVAGLALAATVTAVAAFAEPTGFQVAPWLLAIMFTATEAYPVHVEHRREAISFSLNAIPLVVGLYAVGPLALVGASVLGSALALLVWRRQTGFKLGLNLAQFWFSTVVALLVFHQLGGVTTPRPSTWLAVFAATLAADAVQALVVTIAISLYQRRWEIEAWQVAAFAGTVVNTAVGLAAVTLLGVEPAAVLLLALVVVVLLFAYRALNSLRERHRDLERLYGFTSSMGVAVLGDEVVPTLLREAADLMHAERVWLYVAGEDGDLSRVDLVDGGAVVSAVGRGSADDRLHLTALRAGKAVLLPGVEEGDDRTIAALGAIEAVATPLLGSSGVIGALVAADRSGEVRPFCADDLQLFGTLANHAAVSLENHRLVAWLREQAAANEHQALHDTLTGLPNRTLFQQRHRASLEAGTPAAVLLLDLDRFKEVNDTLGHHHGDDLLQQVAGRLQAGMRAGDVVARLGGDEFAVLLPRVTGPVGAMQRASELITLLERPFAVADVSVSVGASVGVVVSPMHGTDASVLLQRADVALYEAKADQSGVELYEPARDDHTAGRLALVGELRAAIDSGQLDLHFQPQVDLTSGSVIGVEALVRWSHPVAGPIPPEEFVGLAERTGLIRPLTLFVLERALRHAAAWRAEGHDLRVSVNLSPRNLLQATLADDVATMLRSTGVPASALCLELTETSIMADPARTLATLDQLRRIGVGIAIDDFGTGYSSLTHLKRLPVDEIKIDKSFVLSMGSDASDEAIVRSVIDLARNLGIRVVAEGVEDGIVADALLARGCDLGQGYLYSRPLSAVAFGVWLRGRPDRRPNVVPFRVAAR